MGNAESYDNDFGGDCHNDNSSGNGNNNNNDNDNSSGNGNSNDNSTEIEQCASGIGEYCYHLGVDEGLGSNLSTEGPDPLGDAIDVVPCHFHSNESRECYAKGVQDGFDAANKSKK